VRGELRLKTILLVVLLVLSVVVNWQLWNIWRTLDDMNADLTATLGSLR
jgi:regulatory protein YycH of two-component signal transduction system YycFG